MLTPLTDNATVFPAKSLQRKPLDWSAPSVVMVCEEPGATGPDSASAHVNVAVTSVFVQPLAFGKGVREALPVGGVRSILIATEAEVVPPSFPAEHVNVVPAVVVSSTRLVGSQPDWSVLLTTDHVTVTGPLCQPLPFAAGLMCGVIETGGMTLTLNVLSVKAPMRSVTRRTKLALEASAATATLAVTFPLRLERPDRVTPFEGLGL